MKNQNNFTKYAWILVLTLIIASCQKTDSEDTVVESTDQEENVSTTGNTDGTLEVEEEGISIEAAVEPVLHVQYDKSINEETAKAMFEDEVAQYMSKQAKTTQRGFSTEWFFTVGTRTGNQTDNGTEGLVMAQVEFKTDKGSVLTNWAALNVDAKEGTTQPPYVHRKGSLDWYLFRTYYPGQAVSWVQVNNARVAMRGTDDWFLEWMSVSIESWKQTVGAEGKARLSSSVNEWFDNSSEYGWDQHFLGYGSGTIYF